MKLNSISLLLIGVFLYPVIKGLIFGFSSYGLKRDIEGVIGSISLIISIYVGIRYVKNILLGYGQNIFSNVINYLPQNVNSYLEARPIIVYAIIIPIIIFIMAKIISNVLKLIFSVTIFHLIDALESAIKNKSPIIRAVVGAIVQLPRAICYLLTTLIILNIISMFNVNQNFNSYLIQSDTYKYLCKEIVIPLTNSSLTKRLPEIIDDSVKVVVKQNNKNNTNSANNQDSIYNFRNTIVYYNGVTLDQGVKSNSEIDKYSRSLTSSEGTIMGKAKKIYNWENENISYDYQKADKVLNDNYNVESGAISTFNSKKGICFDYACLYAAMCRANNIKVRIVTGDGFNGVSWVSHAWNMVYIPDSNMWINVDTTFSKSGNYFNSKMFNLDHRNAKIIGEW